MPWTKEKKTELFGNSEQSSALVFPLQAHVDPANSTRICAERVPANSVLVRGTLLQGEWG